MALGGRRGCEDGQREDIDLQYTGLASLTALPPLSLQLHLGKIQSKVLRNELIEFLEISAAGRPPCDRANYIEGWNPLDEVRMVEN